MKMRGKCAMREESCFESSWQPARGSKREIWLLSDTAHSSRDVALIRQFRGDMVVSDWQSPLSFSFIVYCSCHVNAGNTPSGTFSQPIHESHSNPYRGNKIGQG